MTKTENPMRRIIDYDPKATKITNLDQLPTGLGLNLLLVIDSPYDGVYIAKRWLRKMPKTTKRCEAVVRLP